MKQAVCITVFVFALILFRDGEAQTNNQNVKFTKFHLWKEFYSEGITVADVNKDGKNDIIAGARWFEAPRWKVHNIWVHKPFDYTKWYSDSFLNYAMDVNEDGWVDLICFDFPGKEAYWYENPRGKEIYWKKSLIDSTAFNESPMMADINKDGKPDLVFSNKRKGAMVWLNARVKGNEVVWEINPISEEHTDHPGMFTHGMGWGDIDGDGRNDVIIRGGWWQGPEVVSTSPWTFHDADLGKECAQMLTYDYDGDGDNDVVSSSAHDYGLWWHEQSLDEKGNVYFTTHTIDDSFSEAHSIVLDDVNKDGVPDLITGKRFYSHQGKGPGGTEPAVLYWFELIKKANEKPVWVRHLIDDDSGVGIQFVTADLNADGKLDFVISNKKGVFYFQQQ